MKKFVLALALVLSMVSCSQDGLFVAEVSDLTQTGENRVVVSTVALIYGESYDRRIYGMTSKERRFTIKVQNLSSVKTVAIHHAKLDGTWIDIEAAYTGPAENGFEIWNTYYTNNYNSKNTYDLADAFCIKVVANGQTYWDNNAGKNYTMNENAGVVLGKDFNVVQHYANGFTNPEGTLVRFEGATSIKNLAYNKKVSVVYTYDGWKTTKVAGATYTSLFFPSYAAPIPSPNAAGVERWYWTVEVSKSVAPNFEYVISYDVNGGTYWDNNYGRNYKNVYIPY